MPILHSRRRAHLAGFAIRQEALAIADIGIPISRNITSQQERDHISGGAETAIPGVLPAFPAISG
jgi:hypothetical protein